MDDESGDDERDGLKVDEDVEDVVTASVTFVASVQ